MLLVAVMVVAPKCSKTAHTIYAAPRFLVSFAAAPAQAWWPEEAAAANARKVLCSPFIPEKKKMVLGGNIFPPI